MGKTIQSAVEAYDHHRGKAPLLRRTSTFRGYVFVLLTLAGFVVTNAFLYFVSTGKWTDFSGESYRQALARPLTDMLTHPLSLFANPWMIQVVGLLLAAIVFVPLMVAMLYRLWVSSLFVLAVALVGHAPVLAMFLAGACALVAVTPLRSNQPFLSMLVGLLPPVLYLGLTLVLFFSSREQVLFPRDWVMVLPFAAALAASVGAGAAVLATARLTKYRPGVIWPALLVCLAVPMVLFYWHVGPMEMEYALIADRVDAGAGAGLFTPTTVEEFRRGQPAFRPDAAPLDLPALLSAVRADLERRRGDLQAACDGFLRRYAAGARAPAVLWIKAVSIDVDVDEPALRWGLVRYRWLGPSRGSVGLWSELLEQYPRSPQAAIAQERLGIAALRDGRIRQAIEYLYTSRAGLGEHLQRSRQPLGPGHIFARRASLPLAEYFRSLLAQTEWLIWLVESNRADENPADGPAMEEYMRLWPDFQAPAERFEQLARQYEKTDLADNFLFRAAMAQGDQWQRAGKLAELAEGATDSAVAADYELGRLAMRLGDRPEWSAAGLRSAEEYFERIPSYAPYGAPAREHLNWLAGNRQLSTLPTTTVPATQSRPAAGEGSRPAGWD